MEMKMNETSESKSNISPYLMRMNLWSSTFYLHRYGSLIWLFSGLIFNILAFIIWMRPRLRRSNTSANYLAGIAMADFLFWILYILYYLELSWDIYAQDIPVWCELFQGLFISIQYFSVVLVLIFSLERYIAVCHPFKRDKLCTHKKAFINTIVCAMISVFLGAIQSIFKRYNPETKKCEPREWEVLRRYLFVLTTGTEILISGLLPFATLIVNILVIIELKSITNKTALTKPSMMRPLTSSCSTSEQHLQSNENPDSPKNLHIKRHSFSQQNKEKSAFKSSTVLLLSVSFLLIFTTLPVGLVYALQFICPIGNETFSIEQMKTDPTWVKFINYQIVKEVVDFLAMIHFSINFVIYYITGESFRSECYLLFRRLKKNKGFENNSFINSNTLNSNKNGNNQRVNRTEQLRKPRLQTLTTDA